jgi:hypothetical protein
MTAIAPLSEIAGNARLLSIAPSARDPLRGNRANMLGEGVASVKDVVSPEGTYERLVGA